MEIKRIKSKNFEVNWESDNSDENAQKVAEKVFIVINQQDNANLSIDSIRGFAVDMKQRFCGNLASNGKVFISDVFEVRGYPTFIISNDKGKGILFITQMNIKYGIKI